jgi:hypothetical protein
MPSVELEGAREVAGVEDAERRWSMLATSFTSYCSDKERFLDEVREWFGDDLRDATAGGLLTAMVNDAMPTSIRTGWLVRAPIKALQPAP